MTKDFTKCESLIEVIELVDVIAVHINKRYVPAYENITRSYIEYYDTGINIDLWTYYNHTLFENDFLTIEPAAYMFTSKLSVEERQYLEILYGELFVKNWLNFMTCLEQEFN